MMNSMQAVWLRLEAIFEKQYPTLLASLSPPASLEQVEAFERASKLSLPTDVRDSYLLHDGCSGTGNNEGDVPLLFCGYRWASLTEMLNWWTCTDETEPFNPELDCIYSFTESEDPNGWADCSVRPWDQVFPRCWFPIGHWGDDHSGAWFIDMLPGPKGHTGQLITQSYGASSLVAASSLSEYLHALADGLERGEVVHSVGSGRFSRWMWRYKDSGKGFLSPQYGW
jgi:cell wall assembly regulator SMI1